MPHQNMQSIDTLVDQVLDAAASGTNAARAARRPPITFSLEEPIASTLIDGLDVARYYGDPAYYAERVLRRRLWRWACFPDDDQVMETSLPASLGFYPEFTYAGMTVTYSSRGVPDLQTDHPVSRDPDLRHLTACDFHATGWMPRALRWHEHLQRLSAGRLAVPFEAVWWRGGLDLAIQLRGYEAFMADTAERPAFAHDLLSWLTDQRCAWWDSHARHFGTPLAPTFVGDDWINVPFISPSQFRDFVLPRYLDVERFHGGIAGVHSCGNQAPVQQYLLQLQSLPAFEVSAWTSLEDTLRNVPASKELVVSLHPNDVLCASPAEQEAKLTRILELCRGRTFSIVTSGLTPLSTDIDGFVRRVRTWTEIARKVRENDNG
jgi:hypothetical protein